MLTIKLKEREYYDEKQNRFITIPEETLKLEHSLKALAEWESKWNQPFLSSDHMTQEQTIDYVRCMSVCEDVKAEVFERLSKKEIDVVNDYISKKMTASTITRRGPQKKSNEKVTAEIIYWWMIQAGIPFQPCETWHLNRLLMLIEVCSLKNGPQQKMGRKEQMAQQRALNNARRAKMHSKG